MIEAEVVEGVACEEIGHEGALCSPIAFEIDNAIERDALVAAKCLECRDGDVVREATF